MVYSTQNTDEGGSEEADVPTHAKDLSAEIAPVPLNDLKDDTNIKLSDLPENYFDDLLDMDFGGDDDLPSEPKKGDNKVCKVKSQADREIQLIKFSEFFLRILRQNGSYYL